MPRNLAARLAWRNVWRNPRRTALTLAATVFAVYLVVFSIGLSNGVHERMAADAVRLHSGHVALSGAGYREERTLDRFLTSSVELERLLDGNEEVVAWAPRVNSFALLSLDDSSQGIMLMGVDPRREGKVTTLPSRLGSGRFISSQRELETPRPEREIVLGAELARRLGAELSDSVLVFSQAYSLESAYELFTVVGTLKLPEPALERALALISLSDAQELLEYGDRISEIALLGSDSDSAASLQESLLRELPALGSSLEAYEVKTWQDLMPELLQLLELDYLGMLMMLMILIVVVGFGILNTILMSVLERTREFGVMMAVGMRPQLAVRIVFLESLMLAGVGLLVGLALAIPTVLYLEINPIQITGELAASYELTGTDPVLVARLQASNPLMSSVVILGVAVLAAWYPAVKAGRGRPVDALSAL